jgi:hypothetical protein
MYNEETHMHTKPFLLICLSIFSASPILCMSKDKDESKKATASSRSTQPSQEVEHKAALAFMINTIAPLAKTGIKCQDTVATRWTYKDDTENIALLIHHEDTQMPFRWFIQFYKGKQLNAAEPTLQGRFFNVAQQDEYTLKVRDRSFILNITPEAFAKYRFIAGKKVLGFRKKERLKNDPKNNNVNFSRIFDPCTSNMRHGKIIRCKF